MLVPGMRQKRLEFPPIIGPVLVAFTATVIGVGAWLVAETQLGGPSMPAVEMSPVAGENVTSLAFIVPAGREDVVYIRSRETGSVAERIVSFPSAFNLHARGNASPMGDTLGLVTVSGNTGALATLTFVTLPDREIVVGASPLDFLSAVTWAQRGDRVAGQLSSLPDAAGRVKVDIIETAVATGTARTLTTFADVLHATPIGYSPDGSQLYVVTLDQSGSLVWTVSKDGKQERLGRLSTGRTRDWRLSPDGSRIAFVEAQVGDRSFGGRVFIIATGVLRDSGSQLQQIGTSWRPGSLSPDFGGPGGSLTLEPRPGDGSYIVPLEWSPDGTTLVASVLREGDDPLDPPIESIQVMSSGQRSLLAEEPGARFLGWVVD